MKLVLWGYYGINYGDNIMLETFIDYFAKKKINIILVDLFSEGILNKKYFSHRNVEIVNLYNYSIFNKLKFLFKVSSRSEYINIWGGGTIFTDEEGDGNFSYFSRIKLLGGNIGYIGVGIGHLNRRKRKFKTKWLLRNSLIVTFRDSMSYDRAIQLTKKKSYYYEAEDIVYLYIKKIRNKLLKKTSESDHYVLITWRNLSNYLNLQKETYLMNIVIDYIEKLSHGVLRIILIALDTKHDIVSCKMLKEKLEQRKIPTVIDNNNSINHITYLIRYADIHISGRLHGSMISEIFGTKTITLSYSPKIEYFYKSIGSNSFISIYDSNFKSSIKKEMESGSKNDINLSEKVNKSLRNFELLYKIL